MIIGGNAQANSKNQFPSQKKISGNSRPSSVSSIIPRRVFSQRGTFAQETRTGKTSMQRMADQVHNILFQLSYS
jgi:hypothetical protein